MATPGLILLSHVFCAGGTLDGGYFTCDLAAPFSGYIGCKTWLDRYHSCTSTLKATQPETAYGQGLLYACNLPGCSQLLGADWLHTVDVNFATGVKRSHKQDLMMLHLSTSWRLQACAEFALTNPRQMCQVLCFALLTCMRCAGLHLRLARCLPHAASATRQLLGDQIPKIPPIDQDLKLTSCPALSSACPLQASAHSPDLI